MKRIMRLMRSGHVMRIQQDDMAMIEGASQRGHISMNGVMWIYADYGADRE